MNKFKLVSPFKPTGDQPQAIKKLLSGLEDKKQYQTLLGVTGSGKTFTLACVIEKINRPVLVISHNKTLASQLYAEFKSFFPDNAVEYFVSYYDYYQPESYIPQTDTYIEKDASINERLDRLRLSTTSSLVSRNDVIVVASVSCIYNLGAPQEYQNIILYTNVGAAITIEDFIQRLLDLHYIRNDFDFKRGVFRVRGDTLDIYPAYKERAIRIKFFNQTISEIYEFDPISMEKTASLEKLGIYPAKHFIMEKEKLESAITTIKWELNERLNYLQKIGKLLEAQRLKSKTLYDLEMLKEMGYCHGIENYSRHLSGRAPGSRPDCLIDYFPKDFLTVIDESHVTIPQIRGMYLGDKSRKETLVEYGFRLESCLDNRPLKFTEFSRSLKQTIFISATPGDYELKLSAKPLVEQIIRPTGLIDPEIQIRKSKNQIEDLTREVKSRAAKKERVLITTLTKRMAEELCEYLKTAGLKINYIHSDIDTLQRAKILKQLRQQKFDALIGVNLLREGLDLPEVSLVAILDADKEGFLRSATSLIQLAGRSSRNINGLVIMYADKTTRSMQIAIQESVRRRKIQLKYNQIHKITPKTIAKAIQDGIEVYAKEDKQINKFLELDDSKIEIISTVKQLEKEMFIAAKNLQFEKAAQLRDQLQILKKQIKK